MATPLTNTMYWPKMKEDMAPRLGIYEPSRSKSFGCGNLRTFSIIGSLDNIHDCEKLYSFEDLFPNYNTESLSSEDPPANSEDHFLQWWKEMFPDYNRPTFEIRVKSKLVESIGAMAPFVTSERMMPDFFLLFNDAPLLWIEIHSGNDYADTIAKLVSGLVLQLRYLRLFKNNISILCGFVFPKHKSKHQTARIQLEWKNFQFYVNCKFLKQTEVISEVDDVLKKHTSKFSNILFANPPDYFLALSDSDLSHLKEILGSESLEQCESHYSILVKDDKHYYKYIPQLKFSVAVHKLLEMKRSVKDPKSITHLVLPEHVIIEPMLLFQFAAQPFQPLSRDEALKCIRDFVIQAKRALQELHKIGYAHVDVRLPNFCFSHNYEAMLIDFDRIQKIHGSLSLIPQEEDFFIPPKTKQNFEGLDFKQLGILIKETLNMKSLDPFTNYLINHGKFNGDEFLNWKKEGEGSAKLSDILSERTPDHII